MSASVLADGVLIAHAAFAGFAVGGGFLVLRWPRLAWLHVPAFAWAVGIELAGGICPLTSLEGALRAAGGEAVPRSLVERALSALLYPANLSRADEIALGLGLFALNAALYAWLVRRALRPGASDSA